MKRDKSACNTYNYSEALYWDARFQAEDCFDWYQKYFGLRPLVRKFIESISGPILVVGCGNADFSKDMVNDGYEDIMNIDISSVAIDNMRRKHEHIQQLKYMQMDVRDMSFFCDASFFGVIDKGTLDALMCGSDAENNAAQMLGEVSRLLKPGGVYMLITYGDPTSRIPHLSSQAYNWNIELYIIPKHGFQKPAGSTSAKSILDPVPVTDKGLLPPDFVLEDRDSNFVYVCKKMEDKTETDTYQKINFVRQATLPIVISKTKSIC